MTSKLATRKGVWVVDLIESERGWGQRVDESVEFNDKTKAEAYVKEFNAKNNLPTVPDWYMYATDPRWLDR